jgi:hypothetical protein
MLVSICIVVALLDVTPGGRASNHALAADQITLEHTYDISRGAPVLEQRIVDEEGITYLLKEVSSPFPETGTVPAKEFVATVQRALSPEVESQGITAVRRAFAETLDVSTDEYAGILHLQSVSQEPVYRSVEDQIERVIVYPDLASEDVLQLPEQEKFTVSSDEGPEALTTQTLTRLAVSWETTGYDADGRPNRYDATVVFRGVERHLAIDYFIATAVYSGLIPALPQRETVLATYESAPEPLPAPAVNLIPVPEPAAPLSVQPPRLFPFILAGAAAVVMLLALLFLLYFFLYKNARLVRAHPTGKHQVLLRRHLRLENGEAVFRIEPSLALYREGAAHLIVLNRQLAARPGQLAVLWGDQVVLRAALRQEIDITEELLVALGDELESSGQEDGERSSRAASMGPKDTPVPQGEPL